VKRILLLLVLGVFAAVGCDSILGISGHSLASDAGTSGDGGASQSGSSLASGSSRTRTGSASSATTSSAISSTGSSGGPGSSTSSGAHSSSSGASGIRDAGKDGPRPDTGCHVPEPDAGRIPCLAQSATSLCDSFDLNDAAATLWASNIASGDRLSLTNDADSPSPPRSLLAMTAGVADAHAFATLERTLPTHPSVVDFSFDLERVSGCVAAAPSGMGVVELQLAADYGMVLAVIPDAGSTFVLNEFNPMGAFIKAHSIGQAPHAGAWFHVDLHVGLPDDGGASEATVTIGNACPVTFLITPSGTFLDGDAGPTVYVGAFNKQGIPASPCSVEIDNVVFTVTK
jgi:hypothetical protein